MIRIPLYTTFADVTAFRIADNYYMSEHPTSAGDRSERSGSNSIMSIIGPSTIILIALSILGCVILYIHKDKQTKKIRRKKKEEEETEEEDDEEEEEEEEE